MKTSFRLVSLMFVFILALSAVGPASAANVWAVGNFVGLCAGTHIYHGPGGSFSYHTIVPEDNWIVKVIDGPRYFDGEAWWDTSRYAAGDPSGGTGWVKQSEADSCYTSGGGGDDGGSGGDGEPGTARDGMLDTANLGEQAPPFARSFTWPMGYKPGDAEYATQYYGFGAPLQYKPCSTAVQNGSYYYLPGAEVKPENRLLHPGKDFAVVGRTGGKDSIAYDDLPKIYAVAAGKVVSIQRSTSGYGYAIKIYHRYWDEEKGKAEFTWSLYAHLHPDSIRVTEGQLVRAGDWIGRYDHTGNWGDVAHIHFELRRSENTAYCVTSRTLNELYYNPETFIPDHREILAPPEERALDAAMNSLSAGAQLVHEQSATLQPAQTAGPFQFIIDTAANWIRGRLALIFPGSTLEISIFRPDGSLYRRVQASSSLQLDLEEALPGTWTYTVKAIDVPQSDYPFSLAVAITNEPLVDTGEFLTGEMQGSDTGDTEPPFTSISLSPSSPDGDNGWYLQPVSVTLSATDNSAGHIDSLYSTNDGATYNLYTGPFILDKEGQNDIVYFSIDAMGNSEEFKDVVIKIDMTPPMVAVMTDWKQYTRVQPFIVHYSGYDPEPGSGLASLTSTFNGQDVANDQSVDMFWWTLGQYTLTATGEDYAGWVTTESTSIQLVATIESLQQTVQRLCQEGYITKSGICNSLLSKLNAALAARDRGKNKTSVNILLAFQNEIRAQTNKSIRPEAKSLLIMDSNYVIVNLDR